MPGRKASARSLGWAAYLPSPDLEPAIVFLSLANEPVPNAVLANAMGWPELGIEGKMLGRRGGGRRFKFAGQRWQLAKPIPESIDPEDSPQITQADIRNTWDSNNRAKQLQDLMVNGPRIGGHTFATTPDALLDTWVQGVQHMLAVQVRRGDSWRGWCYTDPRTAMRRIRLSGVPARVRRWAESLGYSMQKILGEEATICPETTAIMVDVLTRAYSSGMTGGTKLPTKEELSNRVQGAVDFLFREMESVQGKVAIRNPYLVLQEPDPKFCPDGDEYGHPLCPKTTAVVLAAIQNAQRTQLAALTSEQKDLYGQAVRFIDSHAETFIVDLMEKNSFLGQNPLYAWCAAVRTFGRIRPAHRSGDELLEGSDSFMRLFNLWKRFYREIEVRRQAFQPYVSTHANRDIFAFEASAVTAYSLLDESCLGATTRALEAAGAAPLLEALGAHLSVARPIPQEEQTLHPAIPAALARGRLMMGVHPAEARYVRRNVAMAADWISSSVGRQHYNQTAHTLNHLVSIWSHMDDFFNGESKEYWSGSGFDAVHRASVCFRRA